MRTLARGEQIPTDEPKRYVHTNGYILLRWKVGVREYVEAYEHRVVDGFVTTKEHVHHVNRVKTDNRPENLRPVTTAEHASEHYGREWWAEAARLYESGLSTGKIGKKLGRDPANVYRVLVKQGVRLRSEARIAVPYRELQSQ